MDIKKESYNQGIVDKSQGQASSLELSKLSLFKKDSYYAFVYKKTEKLATAIYMLTGFFGEMEPVKNKLRQASLDMLSKGLLFSSRSVAERVSAIEGFVASALECLSILELARVASLVSSMNCEILVNEIENLIQVVEKNEGEVLSSRRSVLTSDFFTLPSELSKDKTFAENSFSNTGRSGSLSGANTTSAINEKVSNQSQLSKTFIKDNKTSVSDTAILKPIVSKQDRGQQILSLMKKDVAMTIKDFTTTIRDCSEKTIQRELLALVSRGVLKKEGERRWSRYSLR
ncbi:MAG: hypothetical protein WCO30_00115 [bacterium]